MEEIEELQKEQSPEMTYIPLESIAAELAELKRKLHTIDREIYHKRNSIKEIGISLTNNLKMIKEVDEFSMQVATDEEEFSKADSILQAKTKADEVKITESKRNVLNYTRALESLGESEVASVIRTDLTKGLDGTQKVVESMYRDRQLLQRTFPEGKSLGKAVQVSQPAQPKEQPKEALQQ